MKKLFASLAVLLLSLALALPASAATNVFSDVTYNNWAYPYVQRAAGEGWVSGVGNGRFAPESNVTGGEFVTMVTRAFYLSECHEAAPGQAWYQGYVDTAQSHGLLTHGINSTGVLNAPLNRYNMAVVLYNLADENGMLTTTGDGFLSEDGSTLWSYSTAQGAIADWNAIPSQYRDPVLACYALGILSGTDNKGTFSGNSAMTRSQAAVVLCKTDDDTSATTPITTLTKEQAQQIALQDAGVSQSSATFVRVYEDWEDGRSVYEVEFYANGMEYDYEIDKTTGKIISSDWDIEDWTPSVPGGGSTGNAVTLDQAKQIALQDAGISESSATFIRAREEWDDGRSIYEIEFYANGKEYDYEIEKSTGKILSRDWDIEGWTPSVPGGGSTGSAVTLEQAKQIALQDAGVSESSATFIRAREDWDDGRSIYEVEFYANGKEYDYEIDKSTGKIISRDWDIENWAPSVPGGGSTGNAVTLEQAKQLVLNRVPGMSANSIRIKQDWDDGRLVYEGEAWHNGTEYEFEIDASTGRFLDWSEEPFWD